MDFKKKKIMDRFFKRCKKGVNQFINDFFKRFIGCVIEKNQQGKLQQIKLIKLKQKTT